MSERYDLTVPIPLIQDNRLLDEYLDMILKIGAKRALLCTPLHSGHVGTLAECNPDLPDLESYQVWSDILKEKIGFFKSHDIELGFWTGHTIGHGSILTSAVDSGYQRLVGPDGLEAPGCHCPLDAAFRKYICDSLAIIAQSGMGLILLDDDFRLNLHPPEVRIGCYCPLHMKEFRERTGMELSREELVWAAFTGEPNQVRKSWLAILEDTLVLLAADIEKAIHAVNPSARIGLATAMTLWSSEGISMKRLLQTLAGETHPLLRTIGAPYWSREPHHAGWIIEYTRLQNHWCKDIHAEILAEGDTFPHTRYHCSAAMLDAFVQGLLASGIRNVLYYGLAYSPHPRHETGYAEKAAERGKYYNAITEFFPREYTDRGVMPVYKPNGIMNTKLPEKPDYATLPWPDEPVAIKCLSRFGIPISYSSVGSPVLFSGYGAAGIQDEELRQCLERGIMMDATAALWLMERGFDIGISAIEEAEVPKFEQYSGRKFSGNYDGERILLLSGGKGVYHRPYVKVGVQTAGKFLRANCEEICPSVVLYENSDGFRFCTYMFDFYNARNGMQLIYNYARQEQMSRCLAWVSRRPLPASVNGYPDVHVICRSSANGDRTAIGLQNMHLDSITDPVIRLDPSIRVGKCIELLLPGSGEKQVVTQGFSCCNDDDYCYLKINCKLQPMEMLCIGIIRHGEGVK